MIRCPLSQVKGPCQGQGEGAGKETLHMPGNLNRHTKELKELKVGQSVKVQNQARNYDKRWARTGTVIEVGPGPRQYAMRMDGSRNVTLRNRKFLRTFNGVTDLMADDNIPQQQPGEGEVQVRQPVNQAGADVGRVQVVRDVTMLAQAVDGAMTEGQTRYPRRERRIPAKYKDFEMGEGGTK